MSGFVLLTYKYNLCSIAFSWFHFQSVTVSSAGSVTWFYWVLVSAVRFLFEKLFEYQSLNLCISASSEVLTGFESVSQSDWESRQAFRNSNNALPTGQLHAAASSGRCERTALRRCCTWQGWAASLGFAEGQTDTLPCLLDTQWWVSCLNKKRDSSAMLPIAISSTRN